MEFINNFKTAVLAESGQLQSRRLSISEQQLDLWWEGKTLAEMSEMLTIRDDYVVNFLVSQLLPHYLATKKIQYEAFYVARAGEDTPLLFCYDCRLFRNPIYSNDDNHFLSAFLLCYREDHPHPITDPLYELVDLEALEAGRWVLKVKESALLKVYGSLQECFGRGANCHDRIVLPADRYYHFIQEWMKCYYNYSLEITVSNFFKGLMALCHNQILLHYLDTLTPAERNQRMFDRPVKVIERPRNVEQFTLTEEEHFGEIRWQTLKIVAYRLKYRVEEQQEQYVCYRIPQQPEGGTPYAELPLEDQCILYAFQTARKAQTDYDHNYPE